MVYLIFKNLNITSLSL